MRIVVVVVQSDYTAGGANESLLKEIVMKIAGLQAKTVQPLVALRPHARNEPASTVGLSTTPR